MSWQKRSVTAPFGHRLSDELSEIILDYLHFDHRLTTTVQWHYKMLEKPVVTTNNGLFLVLAANVQNQHNLRFIDGLYRPVVVLRREVPELRIPSGTLKKRIAMYFCNALFGLMLFWFQNHFPLSGKMILLTKKKMTIDTPPFKTVVPML